EFEATSLALAGVLDAPARRVWEVTGTPHAVAPTHSDRPDDRGRMINRLTYRPIYDAALRALHRWLTHAIAAPHQPRIEMDATGATVLRDQFGNGLGGIRLPEIEAPTFEYRASAFGTGRAPLFGAARPFTQDELRTLYPSREEFIARWENAVDVLVASGALRIEDARAMTLRSSEMTPPLG
ncbi:MAG: alpha/beta hydrolase domain-containing protein, partial [Acidimicrobiia bacterium]